MSTVKIALGKTVECLETWIPQHKATMVLCDAETGPYIEMKHFTRMRDRVKGLERDWREEHRIIEILVAGGFVTRAKVEEARAIVAGFE